MHGDNQIPVLIGHVLEADVTENAGIVEQYVNTAIVLDSGLDDFVAVLDTIVVGYRFAACGFDLVDYDICGLYRYLISNISFPGLGIGNVENNKPL